MECSNRSLSKELKGNCGLNAFWPSSSKRLFHHLGENEISIKMTKKRRSANTLKETKTKILPKLTKLVAKQKPSKSSFFQNHQTIFFRLTVILLWSIILGILINAGYAQINSHWHLYSGLALSLVGIAGLPLLRSKSFAQRFLSFFLPVFLFAGVVGNVYYTKDYVKRDLLYNKNTGDRLTYWFSRYAIMPSAPFYLSMRKFMAGNSIVSPSEKALQKYYAINLAHLKKYSVENYVATGIGGRIFQLLKNDTELTIQQLIMRKFTRENNKIDVERIPFLFFLHQDGRQSTYYLHIIKMTHPQTGEDLKGYIAIPKVIHNAILSSKNS